MTGLKCAALAAFLSAGSSAVPADAAIMLNFAPSGFNEQSGVSATASFSFFNITDAFGIDQGVGADITVTNTTPYDPITEAYLTAFAFDLLDGLTLVNFSLGNELDALGENVNILGGASRVFDVCAYATGSCQAGSGVDTGIAMITPTNTDNSDTFTVRFSTTLTASEVESGFLAFFAEPNTSAVRLRGIVGAGNGATSDTSFLPSVIPLPAPALLLLGGLSALGFAGYRRKPQV